MQLRLILVFIVLFIHYSSLAQSFYWASSPDQFSSTSNISEIAQDHEGNILAYGLFNGKIHVDDTLVSLDHSGIHYFLAKYDPLGNLLWFRSITSTRFVLLDESLLGLEIGQDNSIFIAGSFEEQVIFGTDTLENLSAETDFFVARYSANGDLIYSWNQGTEFEAFAHDLTVDDDLNVYVTGKYSDTMSFPDLGTEITSNGKYDAFLVKYDLSGNAIWIKNSGNADNNDWGFSVTCSEGQIYWGFNYRTGADFASRKYFIYVYKYDLDGNYGWYHKIEGTEPGSSYENEGIRLTSRGSSIYMSGFYTGGATVSDFGDLTNESKQAIALKISNTGENSRTLDWVQEYGSSFGDEYASNIASNGINTFLSQRSNGSKRSTLYKLSEETGNILDSFDSDAPGQYNYNTFHGISIDIEGNLLIGGEFNNSIGFDGLHKPTIGTNFFILKSTSDFNHQYLLTPYTYQFHYKKVKIDTRNNSYVAGTFRGIFPGQNDTLVSRGFRDVFLSKYDSLGNYLFTITGGSRLNDGITDLEVFENHVSIIGEFDISGGNTPMVIGSDTLAGDESLEVFYARFSLEGEFLYSETAASCESDITASDMVYDSFGNMYILGDANGGSHKNFGNGVELSYSDKGFFLLKKDPDGLSQWVIHVNGTKNGKLEMLDGHLYLTGTYSGSGVMFDSVTLPDSNGEDPFIAKYDVEGNLIWVKALSGGSYEKITSIKGDNPHSYLYVTGDFDDEIIIDEIPYSGEKYDIFLIKLDIEGNTKWVQTGGGPEYDHAYDLNLDSAGNPVIVGQIENMADFDTLHLNADGGEVDLAAFVIRYDTSGAIMDGYQFGFPTETYEGPEDDYFNSLSIDPVSNDLYLTGQFVEPAFLDTLLVNISGTEGSLLTRMNFSECAYQGKIDFDISARRCTDESLIFNNQTELGAHDISSFHWDFGDGNTSQDEDTDHLYDTAGIYMVSLTVRYGNNCQQAGSKPVEIIDGNNVDAGPNQVRCTGDNVELQGEFSGSTTMVSWNTSGDGTFNNSNDAGTYYIPGQADLESGFIELYLSSDNLLCQAKTDTLTVEFISMEDISVKAGEDDTLCIGTDYQLSGQITGDLPGIIWNTSGDGTFTNEKDLNPAYTPGPADMTNGFVTLTLSSEDYQCGNKEDSFTLTLQDPARESVYAGDDVSICAGHEISLQASASKMINQVHWNTSGDGHFEDPKSFHTIYHPGHEDVNTGAVNLMVESVGLKCGLLRDTVKVSIEYPEREHIDAGEDQIVCVGEGIQLSGTTSLNIPGVIWQSMGDGTFSNPNSLKTTYIPGSEDAAKNQIELIMQSEGFLCEQLYDTVKITFNRLDSVDLNAGDDQSVCLGEDVILSGHISGFDQYEWISLGDGVFSDNLSLETFYTPGENDQEQQSVELILRTVGHLCGQLSDTIRVYIKHTENFSLSAGSGGKVCKNEVISLAGSISDTQLSIEWSTSGDGSFDDHTRLDAQYSPGSNDLANEEVTLQITTNDHVCGPLYDQVVYTFHDSPKVKDTTIYVTALDPVELELLTPQQTVNGWRLSVSGQSNHGNYEIHENTLWYMLEDPKAEQDYLTVEIHHDCGVDEFQLTFINKTPCSDIPEITILGDTTYCFGSAIDLTAESSGDVTHQEWITNGDGFFSDPSGPSTKYFPGEQDSIIQVIEIIHIVENDCYSNSDTLSITILPPLSAINTHRDIGVFEEIEIPLSELFDGNTSGLRTEITKFSKKGSSTVNDGFLVYSVDLKGVGQDTVYITGINGCGEAVSSRLTFTILNEPPVLKSEVFSINMGEIATIDLLRLADDLNNNIDTTSLQVPEATEVANAAIQPVTNRLISIDYLNNSFKGRDQFTYTWCDLIGSCTVNTIYMDVVAVEIRVYNVLSPNGDGKHDYLKIENIENFPDNEVYIYSSSGHLIYHKNGYDNDKVKFDGRNNQELLPPGNYLYKIQINELNTKLEGFLLIKY